MASTLRPDQLAKIRREEAAEKKILEASRKPKKFKPIVLLGDKKPKTLSQRCLYCSKCLRKYRPKSGQKLAECIDCGIALIPSKSRTEMNKIVRRLKKERRLLLARTPKKFSYEAYLNSKLWKKIRTRILFRDGHLCRDCGKKAKHVHHLSYGPLVMAGNDDSQLVSLCIPCHDARHPDKPSMVKKSK